ncbi:MAG TPA: peptidoglycan DD-metalloendopeptidase family protein [Sphingomicrobium sp.]|nr:peptidoglycan DD-metalloendopeptidase family protein [Sphingomicrobium sp.]
MRRRLLLAIALLVLTPAADSSPVGPAVETADGALERAQRESREAEHRLAELERDARKASDEASRLRAQRAAAAAAIEAAEARISQSSAVLRLAKARAKLGEQRLARKRAPLAALIAGLATMGRQPPLLALADRGSVEEMVRVRALLDSTMPVIERRSAGLRRDLAEQRKATEAAARAQSELAQNRRRLSERQRHFAELEAGASGRALRLEQQAFGAGERVLASSEALESESSEASERAAARRQAAMLAALPLAPARPMRGDSALPPQDFDYSLPAEAQLLDGLGSVGPTGIASRGLRMATGGGTAVIVPADGIIRFAAPFRSQDGVVVIDHGSGWTSLLLGVASNRQRGEKVRRGEQLGRALGPIGVELRNRGSPVSPAFIAASSVALSNGGNSR